MASDLLMYDRCRPSYPRPALAEAERICGLQPGAVVADVGSGTGIFSHLLLTGGHEVLGVEPLAEMRELADRRLGCHPRYHGIAGCAEDTTLATGSVDAVTAASALHWFAPDGARAEFRRILRGPKWVVALWNFRVAGPSTFAREFDQLWRHHLGPPPAGSRRTIENEVVPNFFNSRELQRRSFDNSLSCNAEQLLGLLFSSSNAPPDGVPRRGQLIMAAEALYQRHNDDGIVSVPYETVLYCGRIG